MMKPSPHPNRLRLQNYDYALSGAYFVKRINLLLNTSGATVWQRNFHDHIIRNDKELNAICKYIQSNPLQRTLAKEAVL
jgi:hypothetical protein